MIVVRDATLNDAESILKIYDYYIKTLQLHLSMTHLLLPNLKTE